MYLRLLRTNRDFRLLYVGTLISLGGDWFLTVALLDLVLQLTGSATLVSLMLLCQTLPIFFFTAHAGHVIDRFDRRKLMIAVDLVRIVACLLPLLARTPATLPFAFAGVILISIGSAYFEPASHAALPNLVSDDELAPANVLMGSTWGTMLMVGAAIGGGVTAVFGREVSFVVDAISFLLSAILLARMRGKFSEGVAEERAPFLESIRETIRFARREPRVLGLLTVKGGYGLGAGVVAMLGVFGREVFRSGAWGIGLLFAARGIGALLGPFLLRAVIRDDEARYRSIAWCVLSFGAGYAALALSKSLAIRVPRHSLRAPRRRSGLAIVDVRPAARSAGLHPRTCFLRRLRLCDADDGVLRSRDRSGVRPAHADVGDAGDGVGVSAVRSGVGVVDPAPVASIARAT